MIYIYIALCVGFAIGWFACSLCTVAKESDRQIDMDMIDKKLEQARSSFEENINQRLFTR